MFLMLLKEENKERFLKVCVYAAMSNEIFAEEEKLMISAYCREMNIAEHIPETTAEFDAFIPELAENTDSKDCRQQMNKLQRARMALFQIDTGNTAVIDLTEELREVSTALMPYPGFRK